MLFTLPKARFEPGKTLIFFDGAEAYPEITTALKFFTLDGRFDVICACCDLELTRVESVSVGYQTRLQLNAFDFEEFLWTQGLGGAVTAFFA